MVCPGCRQSPHTKTDCQDKNSCTCQHRTHRNAGDTVQLLGDIANANRRQGAAR